MALVLAYFDMGLVLSLIQIFAGIDACEVEILRRESGAPYVTLYGAARKKAEEMVITDWKISITNTKEVATAFVIAVADDVKE